MRALTLLHLIGLLAAGVYAGAVFGDGYAPLPALGAALVFLAGLFLPALREHAELRRGLEHLEREFMAERDRDLSPSGVAEVFTDEAPRPVWRRRPGPVLPALVILVAGICLLAFDAARHGEHTAAREATPRTISNF